MCDDIEDEDDGDTIYNKDGTPWEPWYGQIERCSNCSGRGYRAYPRGFGGVTTERCSVCNGTGEKQK